MKFLIFLLGLMFLISLLLVFQPPLSGQQMKGRPWAIPDNFKIMKPAVNLKDPAVINIGKELFNQHCKICHGTTGQGDGPKSASLKTAPGNLTLISSLNQTDGEIFYKITKGRDEMPGFEKKVSSQNDLWALVAFVRSMGRK